jgi:hypothetical protein
VKERIVGRWGGWEQAAGGIWSLVRISALRLPHPGTWRKVRLSEGHLDEPRLFLLRQSQRARQALGQ